MLFSSWTQTTNAKQQSSTIRQRKALKADTCWRETQTDRHQNANNMKARKENIRIVGYDEAIKTLGGLVKLQAVLFSKNQSVKFDDTFFFLIKKKPASLQRHMPKISCLHLMGLDAFEPEHRHMHTDRYMHTDTSRYRLSSINTHNNNSLPTRVAAADTGACWPHTRCPSWC